MEKKKLQQKNDFNIFLNEYFSVIVIFLALIVFLLAYFMFLHPKFKTTIFLIEENITTQKKLYSEQERKLSELKVINKVYNEILPADLQKFNKVLPSAYIKESLYGEFEEIVLRQGFILDAVIIEENEGAEELAEMPLPEMGSTIKSMDINVGKIRVIVNISAVDYAGLKKLLKTLESSTRLFDIESIDFSYKDSSLELKLVTYFYKTPK